MAHHDHAGLGNAAPNARADAALSVGITEIAERLGLAVLDQAATKSDVGAVDPNGDIVTGVAGAGVKYLSGPKLGAGLLVWTQPLAAKVRLLRRNQPLLRGKLVRQRIGISRNPRRMQRPYRPSCPDARESPPPARPAG